MKRPQRVHRYLLINGERQPYKVERRSVRYPRLEFKGNELTVILPKGVGDETPLLAEKLGWIMKKRSEINDAITRLGSDVGGRRTLPIFGDSFELRQSDSLLFDSENRVVKCDLGDRNQLGRLEDILKRMLISELHEAVSHYCGRFGVSFRRITVKKQRTKWGSCSVGGNLNFNLWLVCLPKDLIWYLACHEVAHLRQGNHRSAFWSLMGQEFENYREMETRLRDYWHVAQAVSGDIFSNTNDPS